MSLIIKLNCFLSNNLLTLPFHFINESMKNCNEPVVTEKGRRDFVVLVFSNVLPYLIGPKVVPFRFGQNECLTVCFFTFVGSIVLTLVGYHLALFLDEGPNSNAMYAMYLYFYENKRMGTL